MKEKDEKKEKKQRKKFILVFIEMHTQTLITVFG